MDKVYKRMNDDIEVIKEYREESQIQKFYAGKTVFFTGSTGFMGKAFVEKLLRDCPDLKCLYVLIRPKKGLSVEERMEKYFSDVVFSRLRELFPDFESKIHAIEGDLTQEDLGLSESDRMKIIEETDLVFHNASNVKFNEKISAAAKINVMGTAMTIDLAMKCKKVQGFMYVSTAYSHSYRRDIKEEAYPPPVDMDMVKQLIATEEAISEGFSQQDLNALLGKYPNTYVYTKAATEGLVAEASKRAPFPCLIYRPTIVISSWKEPIRAWIDNLNGPAMLFVGYALGVVHVGISFFEVIDFIPVDMAVNVMFVLMWDAIKNRPKSSDALIYNFGSSTVKPITVGKFHELVVEGRSIEELNPSVYQVWARFVIVTRAWWTFFICHFVFHCIPALFFDIYLFAKGKKLMYVETCYEESYTERKIYRRPIKSYGMKLKTTQAVAACKKVTTVFSALGPFLQTEFMIDVTESRKVISRMNSTDHDLFFCDIQELDWADYGLNYWNGLRLYILKDPLSTVQQGIRKDKQLRFLNDCIKIGLVVLASYFILSRLGLM